MIETLAAGLTGGAFTYEIDAEAPDGAHTFRTGQLFIVLDPERGGNDAYLGRVREFVDMLPATRAWIVCPAIVVTFNRAEAADRGIPVTDLIRSKGVSI